MDVLNLIEADARAEGIRVAVRLGTALPAVRANAVQLQQVVLNLTRNAVDAMRDSAGKDRGIEVVTERTDGGGVRISVADHGPGVPRQLGEHIFHPFVTTKREGLGVGLAISRTIVQSYGGSLALPRQSRGRRDLRGRAAAAGGTGSVSPSQDDARHSSAPESPLVYLVDDDEAVRDSLGLLLRSVGLDCELYASALEFLGRVRSAAGTPVSSPTSGCRVSAVWSSSSASTSNAPRCR